MMPLCACAEAFCSQYVSVCVYVCTVCLWVCKMNTLQVFPIEVVRDRSNRERTGNMGDDDA